MRLKLVERITNYLYGYCKVRIEGYSSRALTALLRCGINYWGLTSNNGVIEFYLPCAQRRAMARALAPCGCTVRQLRVCGALHTAGKYRHRPGVIAGAFLFACILWASTYFIWDISVEGNAALTDWQVIDRFEQYGVKFGAFIPSLDLDLICQKYLVDSEDIGWVSVNLSGTCADIVVKERTDRTDPWQDDTPSNIIATEDGQITSFTVWSGKSNVHLGQVVRKGEVLISGVSEVAHGDQVTTNIDRAYGSVMAQVYREYTESVPLTGEHKTYTGGQKTEKEYIFFTKALKSFGNSGNDEGFYDKIIDNERVILFDVLKLPIFVRTTVLREYTMEQYTFSEEQAAGLAQARMMRRLSEELSGCELISRQSEGSLSDGVYTLTCKVYCIADIAKEVEITNDTEDGAP